MRGLGSDNIDTRLRETAAPGRAMRWLGRSIASLSELQRVLVVGSFLRKDHPLFAQRIRQAARKGAKVMSVHALRDDWLMPMGPSIAAAPSAWVDALASIAAAIAATRGVAAPATGEATDEAKAIAAALASGERKAVLLGNAAGQHPDSAALERLGALDRRADRRDLRLARRRRQCRRRAARRRRARGGRLDRRPRCSAPTRRSRRACS